jgi:CDGSH-type Zn-finger protein
VAENPFCDATHVEVGFRAPEAALAVAEKPLA